MLGSIFGKVLGRTPKEIPPEARPPLVIEPNRGVPDFVPDLADPCFCGSGRFFKACCGSREGRRPPPYGVFVVENYIDRDKAEQLLTIARNCEEERLKVISAESSPENIILVEDERRVSNRIILGSHQSTINRLIREAYLELTERFIGEPLAWFETPQILHYSPGGFYIKHADSENMDPETGCWHKAIDRDLSLLIYLNDDYVGGELFFEKFNYTLKPKAGMAVMFPSDNRYMHEAQTLFEGERYAIVSWAAVKSTSKIKQQPPQAAPSPAPT